MNQHQHSTRQRRCIDQSVKSHWSIGGVYMRGIAAEYRAEGFGLSHRVHGRIVVAVKGNSWA